MPRRTSEPPRNPWLSRASLGVLIAVIASCTGYVAMPLVAWADRTQAPVDGFAGENRRAMDRMMAAMDVAPSGDADRDFIAMMVPHHQGAIDMALAELRHGKNEALRRLAQQIIVEQRQEIVVMKAAVATLAPSGPAPPRDPGICTSRPPQGRP